MALQKSIELESGITVPEAYFRINSVVSTVNVINSPVVEINMECYANQVARENQKSPLFSVSVSCSENPLITGYTEFFSFDALNVEGVNLISNSYKYLKTLTQYSDAVDC